MATIYTGIINLSRIPKELIQTKQNGDKFIYVDFSERKTPSMYGDTHYLKVYDKTNRESIYLGDFRPRELGAAAEHAQAEAKPEPVLPYTPNPRSYPPTEPLEPQADDLPF